MTVDHIYHLAPNTIPVLNRFQLDSLLGQQVEFEDACHRMGVCSKLVKKELLHLYQKSHSQIDLLTCSPDLLANSLHQKQHVLVKKLILKIDTALDQVIAEYGASRMELNEIRVFFDEVKEELEKHLYTEEVIIFPAIQNILNKQRGQAHDENKLFLLLYPIEVMKAEHEKIYGCMIKIKKASRNFKVPKNVGQPYNVLYKQLQALKKTLKSILLIENNILYPAALKVERETKYLK